MVPEFEKAGLSFVGKDESGKRMEVMSQTNSMKDFQKLSCSGLMWNTLLPADY
jgi:hypothetical protein